MVSKEVPDEMECVVCGRMAKTIRNDAGVAIMAGIHQRCGEKMREQIEREYERKLVEEGGGDN